MKHGLFDLPDTPPTTTAPIGSAAHQQATRELADRSLVVMKTDENLLPVSPDQTHVLVLVPRDMTVIQTNDPVINHQLLPNTLAARFDQVQHVLIDPQPSELQIFETVACARNADIVVVGVYATGWTPGLSAATEKVLDLDKPVVVLLGNAPYLAPRLPRKVRAVACTFCAGPAQFAAFTDWLAGDLKAVARMPVTLAADGPAASACAIGTP